MLHFTVSSNRVVVRILEPNPKVRMFGGIRATKTLTESFKKCPEFTLVTNKTKKQIAKVGST